MKRKNEASNQTRQNLIDAFWEIYIQKNIEKITVKEITLKAGYNRSTFYEYFLDVYDLLEQLENSLLPNIEDLPPILFSDEKQINSFIDLYSKNSKYYMVLLGENGDPSFSGKMKKSIKEKIIGHISSKDINILELDYFLEYMLSAMIGVLTYWFRSEKNISEEKLISLIYNFTESDMIKKISNEIKIN